MDARPWRLPLAPGISWHEVDTQVVLTAKQKLLNAAGAQLAKQGLQTDSSNAQSSSSTSQELPVRHEVYQEENKMRNTKHSNKELLISLSAITGRNSSSSRCKFPLLTAGWTCTPTDLQRPNWTPKLTSQGLDKNQPVMWVAEGLLYYLEPDTVQPMLQVKSFLMAGSSEAACRLTSIPKSLALCLS